MADDIHVTFSDESGPAITVIISDNNNSSINVTFADTGEKGDPGDKGDKGDQGDQGDPGPTGPSGVVSVDDPLTYDSLTRHIGTAPLVAILDALAAADALAIPLTQKGAASGVATLDGGSKIPVGQLPTTAFDRVFEVASQVAQLALSTHEGDIVKRTDEGKCYVRNSGIAGDMTDYTELSATIDLSPFALDSDLDAEIAARIAADLLLAPKADPAFSGIPTAPTASSGTNSTQIATTAFVQAAIALLINSSPGALDTLAELAAALGNDANFAATVTSALAGKQPLDSELTALAGLLSAANKLPYFTGSGSAALADLTAFARSILDDSDASSVRATLSLVLGTDVQAWSAKLDALVALTWTNNTFPYFTGVGSISTALLTAFARTLLDDADAATALATLGAASASGLATEITNRTNADITLQNNIDAEAVNRLGGDDDLSVRLAALESGSTTPLGTYLVSGGNVAFVSGRTFRIGAAVYYIAGTRYTSTESNVTLDPADGSFDRIDVIALDASGPVKITGSASATPFEPSLDVGTYVRLTAVTLPAAATNAPITSELLWAEGSEWTFSASAGTIVQNSTNNPRSGTKSIEGTNVNAGDYYELTRPGGAFDPSVWNNLIFYTRQKAAWPTKKAYQVTWYNGTTQRGASVSVPNGSYGFNSQATGAYQQIVIPMSAFSIPSGQTVTKIRIGITGAGGSVGFYDDDEQIQAGVSNPLIQNALVFKQTWSSSVAYLKNDVVIRSGSTFVALAASTNADPLTNTSVWQPIASRLSRDFVTITTASLASNAFEEGTVVLGKMGVFLKMVVNKAARVQIYDTSAARTADFARPIGVDPAAEAGVMADVVTTLDNQSIDAPKTLYANADSSPVSLLYYRIRNRSGVTSPIVADIYRAILET